MKGFFYEEEKKNLSKYKKIDSKFHINFCAICGLCNQKSLRHPKLEPYGEGGKGVLVWGEAPGEEEDERGEPFCGRVGQFFRPYFEQYGIDFEKDCVTVNALDCRPPDNRKPSAKEIKCCYQRKHKVLEEFKPKVIFLLGEPAIRSFYGDEVRKGFSGLPLASYRGKIIPDQDLRAWICHSYHPSYIVRGNGHLEHVFDLDFAAFAYMVGKPRPSDFKLDEINILYDEENEVKPFLRGILDRGDEFSFDYETSSHRYYELIHEIYIVGVTTRDRTCVFRYCDEIKKLWAELMESTVPKIAQNIKHEVKATKYIVGCDVSNMTHCTMIGAHVLDGSQKVTGLKKQAYIDYGYHDYSLPESIINAKPKEKNKLSELSMEELSEYCGKDSQFTFRLAKKQRRLLENRGLEKAYQLFHDGVLAFANMEQNGIRLDISLAEKMDRDWGERIEELKEKVLSSKEAQRFKREVGRNLKYQKKLSDKDLRQLLFDILKFKPVKETKTTYSVDEESLKHYVGDCELIKHELELRKLSKLKGTYLAQFLRYQVNDFIYPNINLHIPISYRSSTDSPSFQNIIKHSEEGILIRKIIIPRNGREIWEPDYKSMEVRVLACLSKDPVLMDYVISGGDIHGDETENLFIMKSSELSKEDFEKLRQITKNQAIFPEFYGSYYRTIAKDIGVPEDFFRTLSYQRRYEKWENHVREWEEDFRRRFKGVRKWQDEKAEEYRNKGYIEDGAWGFRRYGYLDRNKLYNFPIQGPAFHCLLWCIIELWKRDYAWESLLCGQIHDAMFWDGVPKEFPVVKKEIEKIMTEDVREANPWIIVPLEVEWKRGLNWLEMK